MSDLISRQAAIDAIDAVFPVEPMKSEYAQGIACGAALAKTYVEQLPSAQPERKTGRWIHDGYAFKGGIDWMHCSECGHKDCWSATTRTPFCAWCGAKMEGEG